MQGRIVAAMAARMVAAAALLTSQAAQARTTASPGWFLQLGMPDIDRASSAPLAGCADEIAGLCTGLTGAAAHSCLIGNGAKLSGQCKAVLASDPSVLVRGVPVCVRSPVCDASGPRGDRTLEQRVEWKQTMGYKFAYPFAVPDAVGVLGVGFDSRGDFWAYERALNGAPSLFKFGPDAKLILTVGEDVTGHLLKSHGMAIDAQDNVWICDSNTSVVEKISPQGKLLMTLGTMGHRGDWDEARGQHLLWQPLDIAFAANGDFFIAEGHANESPNDVDGPDADNNLGAARILHFDRNAHFINQIYGNNAGQGRFSMAHAVAVDPRTGYVWIGDREQYRLVVYKPDGEFVKTLQMRNLTCGIGFDPRGQMWVTSGMDGQVLKVDQQDGHVIGAIGNGQGKGVGQFTESNYLTWDKAGNMYSGDTLFARVTEMMKLP